MTVLQQADNWNDQHHHLATFAGEGGASRGFLYCPDVSYL